MLDTTPPDNQQHFKIGDRFISREETAAKPEKIVFPGVPDALEIENKVREMFTKNYKIISIHFNTEPTELGSNINRIVNTIITLMPDFVEKVVTTYALVDDGSGLCLENRDGIKLAIPLEMAGYIRS